MFDLATSPVFRPCRAKACIRDLDSGGLVGGHRVHRDHPGCRQDYMGLQFVHSLLRDVRYVILSRAVFSNLSDSYDAHLTIRIGWWECHSHCRCSVLLQRLRRPNVPVSLVEISLFASRFQQSIQGSSTFNVLRHDVHWVCRGSN